ncbi:MULTISPECIES: hypothetical protein [unclassified Duganella]|uniref:hypothetical protein n=1 Tax=unclassified Duganella TaxID=2636909 RepID=UPI0011C101E6|nr:MULTISPECIES: hypothetical protein [unclassified Duganella]
MVLERALLPDGAPAPAAAGDRIAGLAVAKKFDQTPASPRLPFFKAAQTRRPFPLQEFQDFLTITYQLS